MLPSATPDLVCDVDSSVMPPGDKEQQPAVVAPSGLSTSPKDDFFLPFATPMLAHVPTSTSLSSAVVSPLVSPLLSPQPLAWDEATLAALDELRDEQLGVLFELSRVIRDAALCKPTELRGHRSLAGFLTEIEPSFASQAVDTLLDKVCVTQ